MAVWDTDEDGTSSYLTWGNGLNKGGGRDTRGDLIIAVGGGERLGTVHGSAVWAGTTVGVNRAKVIFISRHENGGTVRVDTDQEGRYAAHLPAGEYEIALGTIGREESMTVVGLEEAVTEIDLSAHPPEGREQAMGSGTKSVAGPGYRQGMWQTYGVADGFPGLQINDIHQDADGSIWIASTEGLSRFDGEHIVTYTVADGLADNSVHSILPNRDGNLWLGYGESGITRFDGVNLREYSQDVGVWGPEGILCSLQDRNGDIWFGTMDGLIRKSGETFQTIIPEQGWTTNPVISALEDSRGVLWFGTMRGLIRYDGVRFTTMTERDGLPHTAIIDLFEDSKGRLWISTGLALEGISTLFFDPLTPTALCRFEDGTFTTFEELSVPPPTRVVDMTQDRDGNIWFAGKDGLGRYDGKVFETFTTRDGLVHNRVLSVFED